MKTKLLKALLKTGDVKTVVTKILDSLEEISLKEGPQGPKGDSIVGPRGPQGEPGKSIVGPKGEKGDKGDKGEAPTLEQVVDKIEPGVLRRVSQLNHGGGNANRDIKVDNATVLTPYTDIDLIGGSSSILTQSNATTKRTEIIIPGVGNGNYRTTAVNTSIVSGDYTVDCSAAVQVILPTASGIDGKIFDIKNSSSSSVLATTTSSETIDDDSSKTLVQYDSITVQSNGTNWLII